MKAKLLVFPILALWLAFNPGYAKAAESGSRPSAEARPIDITADRLEAYDEKKMVLFSGNALVTQGDRTIRADNILLYYKKEGGPAGREGARALGRTGELEKIEAKGQVTVTQGDRVVTGDQAVYYQDVQKIFMTGNAVMRQGNNVVQGDKIEVFLNENRGVVEALGNKRVKATIYPSEKK